MCPACGGGVDGGFFCIPPANTAQRNIREFLKVRTGYDVFPLSFRLIVMDHDLLIKKSLNIMIQNCV
jgi:hypothetical protein